jgi:hypothetical protein
LKYNFSDRLEYIFECLCCRNIREDKRIRSVKKHYLFQKAEDRMRSEIDVTHIIKGLRKLKQVTQVLFPQRHRMILKYQRHNMVETSSSSSDSDSNVYDTLRLMDDS